MYKYKHKCSDTSTMDNIDGIDDLFSGNISGGPLDVNKCTSWRNLNGTVTVRTDMCSRPDRFESDLY